MIVIKDILRKCQECDSTKEKSINLSSDDYVYVSKDKIGKYYHTECYRSKMLKKGISKENVENEILYYKQLESDNALSTELKDKFYYKIMDIYDITTIPNPYILRVNEVVLGKYKQMKTTIEYSELYEMISNPKFIAKLERIAKEKCISDGLGRMNWDLAIIVSEYDNYKKAKIKQKLSGQHVQEQIKNQIKTTETIKKAIISAQDKKEDDVDMSDLMLD